MITAIWGAGDIFNDFYWGKVLYSDYDIVCVTDNDQRKWGRNAWEYLIVSPNELSQLNIECVIVCSRFFDEIKQQILGDQKIDIESDRIISYKQVENLFANKICELHQDNCDPEIREILCGYKEKGFNIYGKYWPIRGIRYDVIRDSDNWPYVIFENKKMYYPLWWNFKRDSRGEYVEDILLEQQIGSPHLYLRENESIKPGSVIVDAGVCEGNFALRHVETARKIYLIEPETDWNSALERTFAPYRDKVVLCKKFLGKEDSEESIRLDSLVEERIDFLKMDIEGAEIDALSGATETLKNSNARCSICSYHRYMDESRIKTILHNCGYSTSVSDGYMFFIYDENIGNTMDFRRGIVYGEKSQNEALNEMAGETK